VTQLGEAAFIASSADMLQRSIRYMDAGVSEQDIIRRAKHITKDFITHGVVIQKAIQFLNQNAEAGHLCILSTGSYQSGAYGFLEALHEQGLVSSIGMENILVSGAVVDWQRKHVLHANVHDNKIKGLNVLLQERCRRCLQKVTEGQSNADLDIYVYADDPAGNDFGILSLTTPDKRYVIPHSKNHETTPALEYVRVGWAGVLDEECQITTSSPRAGCK